jgi:hypothetical protein
VIAKKSSSPNLDTYKLGAMATPRVNIAVPPAPGASGATGTVPSGMAPSATTLAALPALTTLPATHFSYDQPPMLTIGGLLKSINGEFEPWMEDRPLYD